MQTWMRLQFFVFFFTWAAFISYWGPIFDDRGFDSAAIGLSITVSLVTRAIAVVTLFPLANRRWPLGVIVRVLPWLCAAMSFAFIPPLSLTGLLVLSAVFGIAYPTLMPVLETTASLGAQRRVLAYGSTRMWGSAGFILGAAVDGLVATAFGTGSLLWLFAGSLVALALTSLLPMGDAVVAAQRSGTLRGWGPLLTHRVVVLALAVSILVQSSHAAYYAFGTLRLVRLDASGLVVAVFLVLAPVAEMVVFRVTVGIAERWSLAALMGTAVLGCAARWALWALVPSVPVLLVSQVAHGITFGFAQIAFVQTLRRHVEPELVAPAQGIYSALGMGAGTAALTALAGRFFDASVLVTFAIMTACAVLALPVVVALGRAERRDVPAPTAVASTM